MEQTDVVGLKRISSDDLPLNFDITAKETETSEHANEDKSNGFRISFCTNNKE